MGCQKLTYNHEQEAVPFIGIWKEGSYEKIPINFREALEEKEVSQKKRDHYYPFGLSISALSSTAPLSKPNSYRFNGNEEQLDFDLNLYDFNARMYDAQIGRFGGVDPLAGKMDALTPYHFSFNNPMLYSDPSGLEPDYLDGSVDEFDWSWTTDGGAEAARMGRQQNGQTDPGFTLPKNANEIDTNVWEPIADGDGPQQGHSKRWRNKKNGYILAYDEISVAKGKSAKSHFHLYEPEGKLRFNQDGTIAGNKKLNSIKSTHLKPGQKTRIKLNSIAGGVLGIFGDVSGWATGDPHSWFIEFTSPKIGQIRYDSRLGVYYKLDGKEENKTSQAFYYTQYQSYTWDAEKRMYVGVGAMKQYYERYDKKTKRTSWGELINN